MMTIYQIFGTVIIGLSMCLTIVSGFQLMDMIKMVSTPICAAIKSNALADCQKDFQRDINFANELPVYELQLREVCCAFKHYRQCVSDNLGDKCPIGLKNAMFDSIFKLVVKGVQFSAKLDCHYYEDNLWLCALDYVVVVLVAVGLVVLLLASVCVCCYRARSSWRRDSTKFMTITQTEHCF
ncbi:uncharacterized protein LOC128961226 [Oppia nitens]|uniref:uncharacterized protein LOC128961226 n=1 Tax=Oppia nitens TaxID=1686743 RepID=UPI0023DBEE37|nr:uncharacterized protein LOC128961226 [Oppia nitens]